jgi:hypothetical protein
MSATTLTPDPRPPFSVRRIRSGPTHILGRDGWSIIATVNRDEEDGNAEKMAAGPELLEALRTLRDECDAMQGPELRESGSPWKGLMQRADAAIAKAEGRT